MAKLPTVKIRHRKTGAQRKMNQTDYAANPGRWVDWEIVTLQRGNAPDDVIAADLREADIERSRRADPDRQKKFGDEKRKYDERQSKTPIEINTDPEQTPAPGIPAEVARPSLDGKWVNVRQAVKDYTGSFPRSKDHAKELVDAEHAKRVEASNPK